MGSFSKADLRFFDIASDIDVCERKLPHWSQAGTLCFLTFRTDDSIPRAVLQDWFAAKNAWLTTHGIDPEDQRANALIMQLPYAVQAEYRRLVGDRWHDCLDACHGECLLRDPTHATTVANSLKHFDGQRYLLTDFVVMPNHVHILAAFLSTKGMLDQCDSWKHYTAYEIHRATGGSGRFWQQDGFDHLVRNEEEFARLRKYIADNPAKAKLRANEFVHYSTKLTSS